MRNKMLSTKVKIALLAAIMVHAGFCFAASTKEIDEVRKKTDFTSGDLVIVDTFINQAFKEMIEAPSIADSVRSREDILVRRPKDDQPKYKEQYRKSLESNITAALRAMETWNDENFIKATRLNLAVMIGSIGDVGLYEIAITMLDKDAPAVKYWAIKALTGSEVRNSVRQTPASESSRLIIDALNKAAQNDSPILLEMIAGFAAAISGQNSYDLLSTIASTRIESYKNWTAYQESTDAKIMAAMADKILGDAAAKAALASPFANLMSCTLEKYASGLAPDGGLGNMSQQQLVTVIATLEKNILPKFAITAALTRAVERKNLKEFNDAYNVIFGAEGAKGELSTKLGVDFTVEKLPQR